MPPDTGTEIDAPIDATPAELLAEAGGIAGLLGDASYEETGADGAKQTVKYADLELIKNTKDLPSLVKQLVDSQSEIGRRIRMPGKDATPEELAAFKKKLGEGNFLPVVPEKFTLTKPENLADGLAWNEQFATDAGTLFKEIGLTQTQADRLVEFYGGHMAGLVPQMKTTLEDAQAALKQEFGANYDKTHEGVRRAMDQIFKGDEATLEFLESTGMGNSPGLFRFLAKLSPYLQEDGTILGPGAATDLDAEGKAVHDILNNKENPDYKKFRDNNPDVVKRVQAYYQKRYSTEPGKGASTKKVLIDA